MTIVADDGKTAEEAANPEEVKAAELTKPEPFWLWKLIEKHSIIAPAVISATVSAVVSIGLGVVQNGVSIWNIHTQKRNAAIASNPMLNVRMHSISASASFGNPPATKIIWTLQNAGQGPAIITKGVLLNRRTKQKLSLADNSGWEALLGELQLLLKVPKLEPVMDTHEPLYNGLGIKPGAVCAWPAPG